MLVYNGNYTERYAYFQSRSPHETSF